jgi:CheY-like chemotaxis protein
MSYEALFRTTDEQPRRANRRTASRRIPRDVETSCRVASSSRPARGTWTCASVPSDRRSACRCTTPACSTRQYGGLGPGLGIVRHLVELHGGTVTASAEGDHTGSTFEVCLPLRFADVTDAAQLDDSASVLRGVTVFVVDDDPQTPDFVRTTLELYGAFVVTASTAQEARDRFTRQPPDVLVSDLVMPDEDGLALIRQIRSLDDAHGGRTPAAALTALAPHRRPVARAQRGLSNARGQSDAIRHGRPDRSLAYRRACGAFGAPLSSNG